MNIILSIGILIFTGYILGELAEKVKLPKISGYILAGILLNPDLFVIISEDFVENTDSLLIISLAFITFSIGSSLSYVKIRDSGKTIMLLVVFEALAAFIFVFLFLFLSLYFFLPLFESVSVALVVNLVLASLASPTDPSCTLAVIHEYKAEGIVSTSMLEIAAFDDITGIIIFAVITAFASSILGVSSIDVAQIFLGMGKEVGGAVLTGVVVGFAFTVILYKR